MILKFKYLHVFILSILVATSTLAVENEEIIQENTVQEDIDKDILTLEIDIKSYLDNKGQDKKQDQLTRISLITKLNDQATFKKINNEDELKKLHDLATRIGAKDLAQRFEKMMPGDLHDDILKQILEHGDIDADTLINFAKTSKKHNKLAQEYILDLSKNAEKVDDSYLKEIVEKYPNLKILNLKKCSQITDEGLKEIAKLKNLMLLNLGYCNITSLEPLKDLTKLTYLNLYDCYQIKYDGINHLKNLTNLTYLNLTYCPIVSYDQLKFIVENLRNLTYLSLHLCHSITENGINFLLKYLGNLKILDIAGCRNIRFNKVHSSESIYIIFNTFY
jgi:Leucine-rich repeat (LRR) protein